MSKNKLPTIPPQKPPAQLPAVKSGQLPAVAMASHPVRELKDFAAQTDDLAEHYGRLKEARRNIRRVRESPHQINAQKYLDEAGSLLTRHDKYFRKEAKKLELALDQLFNPDDAYDDDGRLLEVRVRAAIALLLASFPNANPGNPEAYVGMIVEEVMAEDDVSLVVLESACSQIRRRSKSPPAPAHVIEAIQEQAELWEPRMDAIYYCENVVGYMRDELTAAQTELNAATAEREERARIAAERKRADDELRAQPLKAGDRVRHKGVYYPGPAARGTIVGVVMDGFYVCDDGDSESDEYVDPGCRSWERMIPGDSGFEIEEAKRAKIQKRLVEYRRWLQRTKRPVVGDRVTDHIRDYYSIEPSNANGAGTVVCAGDFEVKVDFDNGKRGVNLMACQLRRLLPGEAGFMFAVGHCVAHGDFGIGTVERVDGNKIVVMFDAVGRKQVTDSFLELAE